MLAAQVAQPALDPVADDGVADGRDHDEPDPHGRSVALVTHEVDDQEVAAAAASRADDLPEVTTVGEAMRRGEHGRGSRAGGRAARAQTARLLRPLRRREDRMGARRGCACAGGSRAPCDGDGCSAGTYACSRALSDGGQGRSRRRQPDRPFGDRQRWSNADRAPTEAGQGTGASAGTAHPRAVERPRNRPGRSVDMRHPSTPGDRRTVRVASPRRQIGCRPLRLGPATVRTGRPGPLRPPVPQTSGSLWIASCSGTAPGVMFEARRVSPRSGRTRVPRSPFPAGRRWDTWPLTCGDPVLHRPTVSVSAGCFHKETATFTRCGQTCGTRIATSLSTRASASTGTAN